MKKLSQSLKNLNWGEDNILGRRELRLIFGGSFCTPYEFQCFDGTCVDRSKRMDGIYDCADGSDEFEPIDDGCVFMCGDGTYMSSGSCLQSIKDATCGSHGASTSSFCQCWN